MILPTYPQDWREPWLSMYLERESIMHTEGVPDSAAKAEQDIRRQAEGSGQAEIFFGDMKPMRGFGR
jgi:hypothetical protein